MPFERPMPIERIVIAGGGVAGWMTASLLARKLMPGPCTIQVVDGGGEDISLGYPSVAEATLPSTPLFHATMGLDEDRLLAATHATFTLGRALAGWGPSPAPGFHGFGDIGAPMGPVAFHQLMALRRSAGEQVNPANFSLAALAAQSGRFARPSLDGRSVLSTMDYGIHVDTALYGAAFKADAIARGVVAIEGQVGAAEVDREGIIQSITTTENQRLSGDFYIDCSGSKAVLIEGALHAGFEDWTKWLPVNRIANLSTMTDGIPPAYTPVEARGDGWRRFVPLQGREVETRASIDNGAPFASGRRREIWKGNCVAIGGAAAVVDPLASTSLHLLHHAVERLITYFPHDRQAPIEATEHSRQSAEEAKGARDYAILHYKANGRVGDPFWDECRAMAVPDRLAHKIALFESCGRNALHDGEFFEEADWVSLFDALGIRARRFDAQASGIPLPAIEQHFTKMREVMLGGIATLPAHADYVRQNCKAV
jgi:tryptophan 7-halogenase